MLYNGKVLWWNMSCVLAKNIVLPFNTDEYWDEHEKCTWCIRPLVRLADKRTSMAESLGSIQYGAIFLYDISSWKPPSIPCNQEHHWTRYVHSTSSIHQLPVPSTVSNYSAKRRPPHYTFYINNHECGVGYCNQRNERNGLLINHRNPCISSLFLLRRRA